MKSARISHLGTEQSNPASRDLDTKSALAIARIINGEDAKVAAAIRNGLVNLP